MDLLAQCFRRFETESSEHSLHDFQTVGKTRDDFSHDLILCPLLFFSAALEGYNYTSRMGELFSNIVDKRGRQ